MLVCLPDILRPDELAAIRHQLSGAPWGAQLSAGPQAREAKRNLQLPEDAPMLRDLQVAVMRALNRSALLMSAALPYKIVPPNFNRYTVDHPSYGWHTDSSVRWLPDGSCLRTDVSATLFLSGPDEYDGGELCIQDTYGEQTVKLPAGQLVLYPSGSIHEVRAVTRGERLACYLFMQSVVKDTECRRQLHEMDLALMALRGRMGEADPDLVRLTGIYNNLLRRWSEC